MPETENQDLFGEDKILSPGMPAETPPEAQNVSFPMEEAASKIEITQPQQPPVVMDVPARSLRSEPVQEARTNDRRPEGVILVSIYHFLMGAPGILAGFVIATIPVIAVIRNVSDPAPLTMALLGLGLAVLLTGGLGLLMVITGIGLLRMRNWARWLAITFACLSLVFYPLGTIIGALILVYLLSDKVSKAFTHR